MSEKITLAKALKVKNQLVRKINDHFNKVSSHNSYLSTKVPNFSAIEQYTEYRKQLNDLIKLKTAIAIANTPIHEHIIRMAELKGVITNLRGINTRKGKEMVSGGYGSPNYEVEYLAHYSDKDIDEMVKTAEADIERCQEAIDVFNHATLIEI